MKIKVSKEIKALCQSFVGAYVEADVVNSSYSDKLWNKITDSEDTLRATVTTETLKTWPSIAATRLIYRLCGKDPSRYRPSGEALVRRVLQGKRIYQIDTIVDLINLASMVHGYSIGAFDKDKIVGEELILGIGKENEPYEGICRGRVNIEGLPVYRDCIGGIGTPTTDNERTKIDMATKHLLVIVNGYDGDEHHIKETAEYVVRLLKDYASASNAGFLLFR